MLSFPDEARKVEYEWWENEDEERRTERTTSLLSEIFDSFQIGTGKIEQEKSCEIICTFQTAFSQVKLLYYFVSIVGEIPKDFCFKIQEQENEERKRRR